MSNTTVVPYENPDAKDLRARVEVARARLAEVEAAYTIDKAKVDSLQASLFQRLRTYRQERDRLRLIVDYRRQFLAGVLRGDEGEAERVKQAHREAEARNQREYEETAQTLAAKKELTAEDEAELGKLWKNLVKLYHPDRFAHEPDKLDTYGKLTAAINRAKDNGDFATLRQIANDPHCFNLKQGWASLDFRDEEQAKRLAELYESLMAEIRSVHAARERLRQSPEFELYELTTKQPAMLDTVAEKQRKLLESEIAELNREAARLAGEIGKLTGNPPPGADDMPRASGPADEREASPPPPPPTAQQQPRTDPPKYESEQRPSAAAATNATGSQAGPAVRKTPSAMPETGDPVQDRIDRLRQQKLIERYAAKEPGVIKRTVGGIFWAIMGGMIGALALCYFGDAAARIGMYAGVIGGFGFGIRACKNEAKPRAARPPKPKTIEPEEKEDSPGAWTWIIGLLVVAAIGWIFGPIPKADIAIFVLIVIACYLAQIARNTGKKKGR